MPIAPVADGVTPERRASGDPGRSGVRDVVPKAWAAPAAPLDPGAYPLQEPRP